MSTELLSQNTFYKIGFWCIEEIDEQQVISIMHNAEISLINVDYFEEVASMLVTQYDAFEQKILEALVSS